jgi:galactose-1-phosphate uridylyltransferase
LTKIELRQERYVSEYLDPSHGFALTRVPVEVRWDPLTGQSCRLLPEGSIPPPFRYDLRKLADETRANCPFCTDALEEQTPRFTVDVVPEGRIHVGECVLFPNLVAYAKWSSVSVYSPDRHLLPIEQITPRLLADNLQAQLTFARAVVAHDPPSGWISINANHLPPSGSSVFHPHLQGTAHPEPTTGQRLLSELADSTVRSYLDSERDSGERHIASGRSVDWLASFAPIGPAEIRAIVSDVRSPVELDDIAVEELARGLAATLRVYADLGFQSFNLALYGSPTRTRGCGHLIVRAVARAYFGAQMRSDAMWSERLHLEATSDIPPEKIAALARAELAATPADKSTP